MKFGKRPLSILRKHRRLGPVSLLVASLVTGSANGSEPQAMVVSNHFVVQQQPTIQVASTIGSSLWLPREEGVHSDLPVLVRLPRVDDSLVTPTEVASPPSTGDLAAPAIAEEIPLVSLLPPQSIAIEPSPADLPSPLLKFPSCVDEEAELGDSHSEPIEFDLSEVELRSAPVESSESITPTKPTKKSVDTNATTGALTAAKVNELAQKKILRGYALAERGAYYAARRELVEVLRLVSRSRDARDGLAERTLALAEGLRALEEVEDFAPRGTQLEAEMEISVVRASHRTKLGTGLQSAEMLSQEMVNRYYLHAQQKLGDSVTGEPAGSMALHALGKLYSRLDASEPNRHRLARRHAIAFQQAALIAHQDNHLAAHELGVLLAQSGHFQDAEKLLHRVAQRELHPVVLRNLARVQQEMGHTHRAVATREHALRIAQGPNANRYSNVQWISPAEFSHAATQRIQPATNTGGVRPAANVSANEPMQSAPPQPASHSVPQSRPNWQTPVTANVGFRLAGKPIFFGSPKPSNHPAPVPAQTRQATTPVPPQQWR